MTQHDLNKQKYNLEQKILKGKINSEQVRKEIECIEQNFGNDAFQLCDVTEQPKPWTQDTLQELDNLFLCGAGSKKFLLYMAKVSDEVYRSKSRQHKKKSHINHTQKIMLIVAICILILVILGCLIHILFTSFSN